MRHVNNYNLTDLLHDRQVPSPALHVVKYFSRDSLRTFPADASLKKLPPAPAANAGARRKVLMNSLRSIVIPFDIRLIDFFQLVGNPVQRIKCRGPDNSVITILGIMIIDKNCIIILCLIMAPFKE